PSRASFFFLFVLVRSALFSLFPYTTLFRSTRSAFVVACNDLGAHSEYLGASEIHLGKKESVKDTAKVLGSMYDGIKYRGFAQEEDRKSTRLNSSHVSISYAVFCLKKKKNKK